VVSNENVQTKISRRNIPSHHDAEPLNLLQVNRLGILLQLSAIGRVEGRPWNEDDLVFGIARDGLWWEIEVALPGNCGLFAATVGITGKESILDNQCVSLL